MRDMVTVAATSSEGMSAAELDAFIARLPEAEQLRAAGMRLDSRRRAFVLGRTLLRSAVASLAGISSDDVVVRIEPTGRPVLTGELSNYFVSIAHSGSHVVVAVARRQVGVDVERWRQSVPSPRLMARVCSPDELRALEVLNDTDRAAAFITVWARKEAYGKALGIGIGFGLQSITVGASGSTISGGAATGRWPTLTSTRTAPLPSSLRAPIGRCASRGSIDPRCRDRRG